MQQRTAFLVSAPRSGNTWLRYILEYITKRQTVGYAHHQGDGAARELQRIWMENIPIEQLKTNCVLLDVPIFSLVRWDDIQVRSAEWKEMFRSTPILKRHSFEDQVEFMFLFRQGIEYEFRKNKLLKSLVMATGKEAKYTRLSTSCKLKHLLKTVNTHKLVVLVRDYKEYLPRVLWGDGETFKPSYDSSAPRKFSDIFVEKANGWVDILEKYDEYTGPKIMIHYEDLIQKPRTTVERLQEFMGDISDSGSRYLKFFENLELHKQNSILFYKNANGGESFTKGLPENIVFHGKEYKGSEKKDIDALVRKA